MFGSSFLGSREPRERETREPRRYSFLEEDNPPVKEEEEMNSEIDRLRRKNPSTPQSRQQPKEENKPAEPSAKPASEEPKADVKPAPKPEEATKPDPNPEIPQLKRPSFLDQQTPFVQKPQMQKTSDVTNDYEKFFSLMGQFSRFADEIEHAKRVEKVWFLGKKPYTFAEYAQITGEDPVEHRARYIFVDDKNSVLGEATERDFTLWKYHNNPPIPRLLGFTHEA